MRGFRRILIVGLALMVVHSGIGFAEETATAYQQAAIKKELGDFLASEFKGEPDIRQRLAVFGPSSEEAKNALWNPADLTGQIVDATADPIDIVQDYTVENVKSDGQGVSVDVVFRKIAKAYYHGNTRVIASEIQQVTVRYEMAFVSGGWRIFNPPLPRVGADAVLNSLRLRVQGMDSLFKDKSQMSVAQRRTYEGYESQFEQLQQLVASHK